MRTYFFTACQEGIFTKALNSTQTLAFYELIDLQLTHSMNFISFILNGQRGS